MPQVGGPIEVISIGGRDFAVPADADVETDLGGKTKERQANGDGVTARQLLTPKPWMLGSLTVAIDDFNGDLEFLQAVSNSPNDEPISIVYASGAIRTGTGSIQGDLKHNAANATASFELAGGGTLTLT